MLAHPLARRVSAHARALLLPVILIAATLGAEEPLFVARPLTEAGLFTEGIEGPACDRGGHVYAVNFERQGTIGRVSPDGKRAEVYVTLPEGSIGNGLRFDSEGRLFVADYARHNVLRVDPRTRAISVLAHEPAMSQPNDLTIAANGVLYASDPSWKEGTGQLWRIGLDGAVRRVASGLGTTNGIELSPDGTTLYVNESVQRGTWAFPVLADGGLGERRLLLQVPDFGYDGMRCDVDGNLYITRHGKGVVAIVSPKGEVLREVDVLGSKPSNLCFGGPDGRTVYVTEVEHQRLVQFRVERPGLAWLRWREGPSALERDPAGWEDLLPKAGFPGWRRVVLPADPPSDHDPWSLSADGKTIVAKGQKVKEMLLEETPRGDGIFHVEWRFTGGTEPVYNGGIYVRTALGGIPWVQAQVADGPRPPRVGDIFSEFPDEGSPGKLRRVVTLSGLPGRARPPGEWNVCEVTCRGSRISLWVNGAETVEWPDCPVTRGHVGLQAELYDIEYRALKYKPLEAN